MVRAWAHAVAARLRTQSPRSPCAESCGAEETPVDPEPCLSDRKAEEGVSVSARQACVRKFSTKESQHVRQSRSGQPKWSERGQVQHACLARFFSVQHTCRRKAVIVQRIAKPKRRLSAPLGKMMKAGHAL